MKILFFGDISLNDRCREIAAQGQKHLFFKELKELVEGHDVVIGNMETVVEGDGKTNPLKQPKVWTDLNTIDVVRDLDLDIVTLANNHVYDCLEEGLKKTIGFLKGLGIATVGAGFSEEEARRPYFFERDGVKTYCFAYVTSDTNPSIPDNAGLFINLLNKDRVIKDIEYFKDRADVLIVMLHWGVEQCHYPEPWQIDFARSLIKAGVHVVIGHHPHVVQGWERYDKGFIAYSLGNLIAADLIEGAGKMDPYIQTPHNKESIAISLSFSKSGLLDFEVIPLRELDLMVKVEAGPIHKRNSMRWCRRLNGRYYSSMLIISKIISRFSLFLFKPGHKPVLQFMKLLNPLFYLKRYLNLRQTTYQDSKSSNFVKSASD